MKTLFKKLNQRGFAHWAVPALVIVIIGAVGTYVLSASHADNTTTNISAAAANIKLTSYTLLGSIPASSLYDVKVPPPKAEQPSMKIYACTVSVGPQADTLQFIGVLSKGVPATISTNWYDDLNLSSSATTDNIVSNKVTQFTYQNNIWTAKKNGKVTQSAIVSTDQFDPGVITDFYVWASGSYGGSVYPNINNHPNVTQIATCGKS